MDCLESLALNVSTDFASMNIIHFAKLLRTLLALRSNPQIGSHPHRSNKKDLGKSQSLFYGAPDEGLRCEAEKGD